MLTSVTTLPIEMLYIEDDGAHLLITVAINGKDARLLIDTGASRTVFDKERIKFFVEDTSSASQDKLSTGLGTTSMPTSLIRLQTLRLGELLLNDFETVLLDLQHVNDSYGKLGFTALDGVLGNDVLLPYDAIINYKKLTLTLGLSRNY